MLLLTTTNSLAEKEQPLTLSRTEIYKTLLHNLNEDLSTLSNNVIKLYKISSSKIHSTLQCVK